MAKFTVGETELVSSQVGLGVHAFAQKFVDDLEDPTKGKFANATSISFPFQGHHGAE